MKQFFRQGWASLVVMLLGWPTLVSAQTTTLVKKIEIKHVGPPAASESLIRANIRVKEGDTYNRLAVDDDVRNLYNTGYFYLIQVTEERTGEGLILTYVMQGKPTLTEILFTGNKKFNNAKLLKKVTSKVGQPLDERKLFSDAQAIKTTYEKSGYPKTEVKPVPSINQASGRGTVTFEITEQPKVKVVDVTFEGASVVPQKKLRKVIKTRRHWMFSWLTGSGKLKDEQLEDDRDKLANFYREKGYIDFELKDVKFEYETPQRVKLNFIISEGRQYRVGAVGFTGVTLFSTNDIFKKLKMKVGEIFTPKGLSTDLEAVQDFYGAKGYIGEGNAEHIPVFARKNANTDTGTMDLVYEVTEGDRSYIEKIEIKGNTDTKDKVIRRELAVSPGEPFDMVGVKRSKSRLEQMNFFEKVETKAEETDVPNRKNLVVAVEEKNTGNFTIGAGFSSVDSLVGFAELTQGNFDLFKPPLFKGGGQKFRLRVQIGTERQDYIATFIEPWFLNRKLQLGVDAYHRFLGFLSDEYDEQRTGGRLSLTRALGSDFLIGSVNYTLESVGIVNTDPFRTNVTTTSSGSTTNYSGTSPEILEDKGYHLVSKFGSSLAYDTRNNSLSPNKGQRTELTAEIAGGILGGEVDIYKLELKSAWYFPGFFEGHVWELVGRAGVVDSFNGTDQVPIFERWFLGGAYSLRGYKYRHVGPRTELTHEPLGGDTYWFGSAEYTIPVIERVRLALFYDIGNVYTDAYDFNFGDYLDNWGIGVRINIPALGPLRLDYGIPIKKSGAGRFNFTVGYTREF